MGGPSQDDLKRMAAEAAVAEVEDGMVLGLGTGSTAAFAVEALAARMRRGLRIVGIPTSEGTAEQARRLGVPLATFAEHRRIDLTIDGADEVEQGTLNLVKGLGGALLREKIVAAASRHMTVIVDETKLVDRLGSKAPVPVEIVPFGWESIVERLAGIGGAPTLRLAKDGGGVPFRTDGGNYIADCAFGPIADSAALEHRLAAMVGVIESGLFIGMATRVIVGGAAGVRVVERGMEAS
jgi:ribose 5-phosphate isomerase A